MGKFGGDTDNWQWPRYSARFRHLARLCQR
ncbi:S46 family peptidase [Candidatus Bacteroides intestinigallinarum]|nr:S46 family peptidase [Candidatus Bacteroides intestinigallinarum]